MSEITPSMTASDIISDVETRLGTTNLSSSNYLPWISYAYQKTYLKLMGISQKIKEELFGAVATFNLSASVAEYNLSTTIPQYGGFIKCEVKYGGTGDDWVKAKVLPSLSKWTNQEDVTSNDWAKSQALVYFLKDVIGFIPTPPAADSGTPQAKVWYVKRPVRITQVTDVIDLPYRFIYPIVTYTQAMAIVAENEDYRQAGRVEQNFRQELDEMAESADSETSEYEEANAVEETDDALRDNPLGY